MAKAEALVAGEVLEGSVKPAGLGFVPLVLALAVAIALAMVTAGGAMYWLIRSGRLAAQSGTGASKASAVLQPPASHEVALEPLLVNLADEGGRAYLRVSITLRVLDSPLAKGEKAKAKEEKPKSPLIPYDAEIRDAALSVIGGETAAHLLAPDGKQKLKADLRSSIAGRVPEMKVDDLFFTEFLVQQ